MVQRRFRYDVAFERYLRDQAIPYVAVDEAKRALCDTEGPSRLTSHLKNFDFVVYSQGGPNLLVDVKGRKHAGTPNRSLQNWVTADDVACLEKWQQLFGSDFKAVFAFLYWCDAEPPAALFQDVFSVDRHWYSLLTVTLDDYKPLIRTRSPRWRTVDIPAPAFNRITQPLPHLLCAPANRTAVTH